MPGSARARRTRTGLREDQAAAALAVLTDGRRVSVINAPAGSGQTWVLAVAGQAWAAAGLGRVIGITPSQSARNTLAANGDLLRIDAITRRGLVVRRALDADPATGQRRWTDRHFLFNSYQDAELGYAVTDHVAQGRTVTAGLAVITGAEDRPHALVALTRGTTTNLAYVFTQSPAPPLPGPRPAPELARYDNKRAERSGVPAPPFSSAPPGQALAVLAAVLDRDGQLVSATQDRHRALADADHLTILHAIWTAETTPDREQRYKHMVSASLPPGYHRPLGLQARWLWRTLRAAELAGLDPAQLLAAAIAERDLAGSRDLAAVIDARLRHRLGAAVPLPVARGPARSPPSPTPNAAPTWRRSPR